MCDDRKQFQVCFHKEPLTINWDQDFQGYKGHNIRKMDEGSDSEEGLLDSLDDNGVQDSGVGSSSEKAYRGSGGSKVEVEIQKFQREIEKANMEKSKVNNWHERRKKSRSASTDSLLSMDEGSDHSSGINIVPTLPPKGRFLSTDNLSPPKLPPKQQTGNMQPSTNLNKRVSISTNTVHIINSDTDCLTDGSVAERIKTFMNQKVYEGQANKISSSGGNGIKARPRRTSETSGSNQDLKIGDLPKELPSVRNLAFMFSSGQRKSPEPLPRSSLNKKTEKKSTETKPVVFNKANNHSHQPFTYLSNGTHSNILHGDSSQIRKA